jgi:hypothetical protein
MMPPLPRPDVQRVNKTMLGRSLDERRRERKKAS